MPLPLIPLLVAGGVAASAAVAGKKGYDSYLNMKEVKEVATRVEQEYENAFKVFDKRKEESNDTLANYGLLKLEVYEGVMKDFVGNFQELKNVEFQSSEVEDFIQDYDDLEKFMIDIEKQVVQAENILAAGTASLAGGGLTAMGALGATKLFAAASTGTKIAALSGVAAKNATLAFLGGGALSAGGFGMAGGMAVLGGIAVAPALAIGSLIFATTTEKKLVEMYTKKAEVDVEIEKLRAARITLIQITETTEKVHALAKDLSELLQVKVDKLTDIILNSGVDFERYTKEEQTQVFEGYQVAGLLKGIFDQSILSEAGEVAPSIMSFIQSTKEQAEGLKR